METNVIYFSFEECRSDFDASLIGEVSPVPYPAYSLEPEVPSLSSLSGNGAEVNSAGASSDWCACWCREVATGSTGGKCEAVGERELSHFVDHPARPRRFDAEDIAFASGGCQRRRGLLRTVDVDGSSCDTCPPARCGCDAPQNFNARICLALEKLCDLKKSDSQLLRGLTCQIGELRKQQSELFAAMSDWSKESTDAPGKLFNGQEQSERDRSSKRKSEASESKSCRSVYDGRVRKDTAKFKQAHCVSDKTACIKRMKLPYERLPGAMKSKDGLHSRCESETSCSKKIPTFYEKLLRKAEKFLQRHAEAADQKSRSSSETSKERFASEGKDGSVSCPDEIDICERTVRSQGNDLVDAKTSYHLSDVIGDGGEPVFSNLSLESRRYLRRYNIIPS